MFNRDFTAVKLLPSEKIWRRKHVFRTVVFRGGIEDFFLCKATNLISLAQNRWSDSVYTFKNHQAKSVLHKQTTLILSQLLSNASGKTQPIDEIMNSSRKKKIEENRDFLIPIVDTILLCGRLGLSLRGHRDDSKYAEVGEYSTGQVGNFIEILQYRVRSGDKNLEQHLSSRAKNASYISKTSQNDIITCCGGVISDKIISEIKRNKFFFDSLR